jgi:hypothetical protein
MALYQGTVEKVNNPASKVFEFLEDFRNFERFLPEQISQWEATDDYCMFLIQGMGKVKLTFAEKTPNSLIVVQPAPDSGFPVPFHLKAFLMQNENNPQESTFQFVVDAVVPPMISFMVDKPLSKFVEIITLRLKDHMNNSQQ